MFFLIVISTLVVIGVLGLMFYFNLEQDVIALFYWLDSIGLWSMPIFIGIITLLVILILPTVLFTLGAGYLFGVFIGCLCVVLGTTCGATIAFFIARFLFSDRVSSYLKQNKKLKFINDEFVHEGWKFILILRLVPFFPLKLSNYFFGITNFKARHFILGTFFGIIPNSLLIVYLGSMASDLYLLLSGNIIRSPLVWGFNVFGLMVLIAAVRYITNHAQSALSKYQTQSIEERS